MTDMDENRESRTPEEASAEAATSPNTESFAEEPTVQGNAQEEPRQTPPTASDRPIYTYVSGASASSAVAKKAMPGWLIAVIATVAALAVLFGGIMIGRALPDNGDPITPPAGDGGTPALTPSVDRGDVTIEVVERENGVPSDGTLPAVVASVAPAVVEIRTTTTVTNYYYDNYVQSGAGSGVLIQTSGVEGLILTCNHVIDGADQNGITVVLSDGRTFSKEQVLLLGQDVWSDLALLQIVDKEGKAPTDLTYAKMATGKGGSADYSYMTVGETVVAIGNPLGELGGSVSRGIISALGRKVSVEGCPMTLMQVDASVNPGNSGGGLFNMDGQLIGIVNAKSTGDAVEGIGFAIPTSDAIPLVKELYQHGYVSGRPYLGLFFNAMTSSGYYTISAYRYTEELPEGVTINYGDYLYSIDGTEITSDSALRAALAEKKVGDTVDVVLIRIRGYTQTEVRVSLKVHEYTPEDAVHPTAGE